MERQIEVTGAEHPAKPTGSRERRESGWTLLATGAVGVLVGAAAVFLLSPSDAPAETPIAEADDSLEAPAVVVATLGTVRPPPSLAERVPGLTSDLVAFGFTPSGQAVIQQWFINATEPRTIDVPFGYAIADTSEQWIAALASQRYGESSNLHVGNGTYQEAIATNVGSAVWSTDEPGRIVWTEQTAEGVVAFDRTLGRDTDEPTFAALPLPPDARAVWFDGDTAIADASGRSVQRLTISSSGSIISLLGDGTEVARLDGAEFVAATDGWAVVRRDGELTLVDDTLTLRAPIPVSGESCGAARFAKTDPASTTPRLRLAVLCGEPATLEVIDIDPAILAFTSRAVVLLAEPGSVAWLDGDRFVAVPQPDPVSRPRSIIAILDVDTGEMTQLQWPGAVFGVIGTR
jgi:hypothetical protein